MVCADHNAFRAVNYWLVSAWGYWIWNQTLNNSQYCWADALHGNINTFHALILRSFGLRYAILVSFGVATEVSNVNLGAEAKPVGNHTPKPKRCMCMFEKPGHINPSTELSSYFPFWREIIMIRPHCQCPQTLCSWFLCICMNVRRSLMSIKWKNSHDVACFCQRLFLWLSGYLNYPTICALFARYLKTSNLFLLKLFQK